MVDKTITNVEPDMEWYWNLHSEYRANCNAVLAQMGIGVNNGR